MVIREMVDTEKTYIDSLGAIMDFKRALEEKNILNDDDIHTLFSNVENLEGINKTFYSSL